MVKTKIANWLRASRLFALVLLGLLIFLSLANPLGAQTVTQGYGTDEVLQRGMLVVLNQDDTSKVSMASYDEIDRLHGIVVNPNDAPVTLSEEGQQVFVATTGRFDVLVSDENGPIGVGEQITASSVRGIGMKADARHTVVIGKALEAFDGTERVVSTTQLDNGRSVEIGRIPVDLSVVRNPQSSTEGSRLPAVLHRAAETLAGEPVSDIRIYVGLAVLLVSSIIGGSILYAGVRSSIVSIGRNPLSKPAILRGLLQVILTSLIIFISGIFAVYLLLKL